MLGQVRHPPFFIGLSSLFAKLGIPYLWSLCMTLKSKSCHLFDCHLCAEVLKRFRRFLVLARSVAYCGIDSLLLARVSVFFEELLAHVTKVHREVLCEIVRLRKYDYTGFVNCAPSSIFKIGCVSAVHASRVCWWRSWHHMDDPRIERWSVMYAFQVVKPLSLENEGSLHHMLCIPSAHGEAVALHLISPLQ